MGSFQAQYGGSCDECQERIKPGDRVTYIDDGVLVHVGCADPDRRARRSVVEVACGECFILKPCGCEDGQ